MVFSSSVLLVHVDSASDVCWYLLFRLIFLSKACSVLFSETASSSGTPATLPRSVHSEQIIDLMMPVLTMQLLRPSLVPEYLRNSSFFLWLNVTEDDVFFIPPNHMKHDTSVDTLADMTELLNTIRFWGSDIIPQTLFDFAARQPRKLIIKTLETYREDLPFLTTVCRIVSRDKDGKLFWRRRWKAETLRLCNICTTREGPSRWQQEKEHWTVWSMR